MQRIVTSSLLALGLTLGACAQSGWKNLNGKPVPAVRADQWLNTGGEKPTSESLKGKVWLLEFFATW